MLPAHTPCTYLICLIIKLNSNVHMTYDSPIFIVPPPMQCIQHEETFNENFLFFSLALHTVLQRICFIMINILFDTVHFQKTTHVSTPMRVSLSGSRQSANNLSHKAASSVFPVSAMVLPFSRKSMADVCT